MECDAGSRPCSSQIDYFNPRTHVECDQLRFTMLFKYDYFNPRTHVECDYTSYVTNQEARNFNPRTHVECDCAPLFFYLIVYKFQSTHSRGVRPLDDDDLQPSLLFQSTHSRGVRLTEHDCTEVYVHISIHALTWSATAISKSLGEHNSISIHALTWSATGTRRRGEQANCDFNPRTHVECDQM